MRVAAHVRVMDEANLIRPCLDHLRRIGVGYIVVHDMGSTDGTRAILRARAVPHLRVVQSGNAEPAEAWHDSVVAALARIDAELVHVPRYNVVLGSEGLCLPLPPEPETYGHLENCPDRPSRIDCMGHSASEVS